MKKTLCIDMCYQVKVPTYVNYDTDFIPEDGVAYMVMCETEDQRFFHEAVDKAEAMLNSLPGVSDAVLVDDGQFDFYDVEYDPSLPMWTDYMRDGYVREEKMRILKDAMEDAVEMCDYDAMLTIAAQIKRLGMED